MKVPKKTAITLLAMLCFTSQTHAFVVTDLATDVLMPLVQSQLGDLSNISDLNLEEQYKQLSQLESIYDELKSGDAISELEWGDLIQDSMEALSEAEGMDWINDSGVYDIFGGMDGDDLMQVFREPREAIAKLALENAPFDVDPDDLEESLQNGLEWYADLIQNPDVEANTRREARIGFAGLLQAQYLSTSDESLETANTLAKASQDLGSELDQNTNIADAMKIQTQQSAVQANLTAEQIRQEREANEALIANDQAELEILRQQMLQESSETRIKNYTD